MQRRLTYPALSALLVLLSASGLCLASAPPKPGPAGTSQAATPRPVPAKRVDINSASRDELKTLPGIGDAEAARIIAARPYPSKAKLVEDKVLTSQTYWALEELIVAVQKPQPKAKADAKSDVKASSKP
jgi:competence protein ComEA